MREDSAAGVDTSNPNFKVTRFSTCKQAIDISANRFRLVYQQANNCCITAARNQTADTKLFIPPSKDFGASNATRTSFTELGLCFLVVSNLYPAFPWSYISCFSLLSKLEHPCKTLNLNTTCCSENTGPEN